MRAIILLCLLHSAFAQDMDFSWYGPTNPPNDPEPDPTCYADQSSCGCCLMKKHINRMELFFNMSADALNKELTKSKLLLNNMRASRSAFSVGLNQEKSLSCYGPFTTDKFITYSHVFINMGNSYDAMTGIFTVPRSGVYSLALTVYTTSVPNANTAICTNLLVNGNSMATLTEASSPDYEDSNTVVMAVKLRAGDKVGAKLLRGCTICDDLNHYNTFTGFLLYATD